MNLNIVLIRMYYIKITFFKYMNLVYTAKNTVALWHNGKKKDYRTQKKFFILVFIPYLSYVSFEDEPLRRRS